MEFSFTEEQLMFKDQVIKFARNEIVPRCAEHDLKEEFDFQSFRKLGEFGILGLHLPEHLGGSNADIVTTVLAGEPEVPVILPGENGLGLFLIGQNAFDPPSRNLGTFDLGDFLIVLL